MGFDPSKGFVMKVYSNKNHHGFATENIHTSPTQIYAALLAIASVDVGKGELGGSAVEDSFYITYVAEFSDKATAGVFPAVKPLGFATDPKLRIELIFDDNNNQWRVYDSRPVTDGGPTIRRHFFEDQHNAVVYFLLLYHGRAPEDGR